MSFALKRQNAANFVTTKEPRMMDARKLRMLLKEPNQNAPLPTWAHSPRKANQYTSPRKNKRVPPYSKIARKVSVLLIIQGPAVILEVVHTTEIMLNVVIGQMKTK
uniref:Uncharacterized protein n=1 Tax=Cacopsylla melanoneura TaxID=428564 RepID=A0A8D8WQJ7_9HEMI